jgi:hypothetical protein
MTRWRSAQDSNLPCKPWIRNPLFAQDGWLISWGAGAAENSLVVSRKLFPALRYRPINLGRSSVGSCLALGVEGHTHWRSILRRLAAPHSFGIFSQPRKI